MLDGNDENEGVSGVSNGEEDMDMSLEDSGR